MSHAMVVAWKDGFARKELSQDATDTPKIHALEAEAKEKVTW